MKWFAHLSVLVASLPRYSYPRRAVWPPMPTERTRITGFGIDGRVSAAWVWRHPPCDCGRTPWLDRRITKDVNGSKTAYFHDGPNVVAEYKGSNQLQRTHVPSDVVPSGPRVSAVDEVMERAGLVGEAEEELLALNVFLQPLLGLGTGLVGEPE